MPTLYENAYSPLFARPFVRLSGYSSAKNLPGELTAYLNYFGATCTAKDALAEGMLAIATEKRRLKPGQPIVEADSGTFAAALCIAAKRRGHELHLVIPGNINLERRRFLTSLGAKVTTTSPISGPARANERAVQLQKEHGAYFINHKENDDNTEFHRRVTGPAIRRVFPDGIDAMVTNVATGATVSGAAEYIKAWLGQVYIMAVGVNTSGNNLADFAPSAAFGGRKSPLNGGNYNPYIVDETLLVSMGDAKSAMLDLLDLDAVPADIDAAAVVYAAQKLCRDKNFKNVVCILNGSEIYM